MFMHLMTRFIFLSMLRKRLVSNILSISGVNCLRNRRNDMAFSYLNGETLEKIEKIIQKLKDVLTEIAVLDYKQCA